MASGPITCMQIEGEKVEAVTDFLFLGSKVTVDSDCSHEATQAPLSTESPGRESWGGPPSPSPGSLCPP